MDTTINPTTTSDANGANLSPEDAARLRDETYAKADKAASDLEQAAADLKSKKESILSQRSANDARFSEANDRVDAGHRLVVDVTADVKKALADAGINPPDDRLDANGLPKDEDAKWNSRNDNHTYVVVDGHAYASQDDSKLNDAFKDHPDGSKDVTEYKKKILHVRVGDLLAAEKDCEDIAKASTSADFAPLPSDADIIAADNAARKARATAEEARKATLNVVGFKESSYNDELGEIGSVIDRLFYLMLRASNLAESQANNVIATVKAAQDRGLNSQRASAEIARQTDRMKNPGDQADLDPKIIQYLLGKNIPVVLKDGDPKGNNINDYLRSIGHADGKDLKKGDLDAIKVALDADTQAQSDSSKDYELKIQKLVDRYKAALEAANSLLKTLGEVLSELSRNFGG